MTKTRFPFWCLLMLAVAANVFAADAGAGKAAVEKYGCASCHGTNFNSPVDPSYPKLAGQHEDYLRHALRAYQRGAKSLNGRGNPVMGGMAKPLSPTEIDDIAAYLSGLKGSLVLRK